MKEFEYKMVVGYVIEKMMDDEILLKELGNDGWELVSVVYPVKPRNKGLGAKAALYYLKREILKNK